MAYMSQENKAKLAPKIKEVLKKHGVKGSLSVRHHSTLVLTVKSGKIDFVKDYQGTRENFHYQVNTYHADKHFGGKSAKFLSEVIAAMKIGNHDNSDPMTDYFDVGWYVDVNIGHWNKPYELTK